MALELLVEAELAEAAEVDELATGWPAAVTSDWVISALSAVVADWVLAASEPDWHPPNVIAAASKSSASDAFLIIV